MARATAAAIASPAIAPVSAATPAETRSAGTPPAAVPLRTRPRRPDRLGERLHIGRNHHYLADGSFAHALAAHFCFAAQRQVDDAALAAVHGAEVEGLAGLLHALG